MITGSGSNSKLAEQKIMEKATVFSVLKKYVGGGPVDIEDIEILREYAGKGVEIDGTIDWANSNGWYKKCAQNKKV